MKGLIPREEDDYAGTEEVSPELRECAMRLATEARNEDPELSSNAAVVRIEQRVGVKADTLRGWCKQAAIDQDERRERRRATPRGSSSSRAENR